MKDEDRRIGSGAGIVMANYCSQSDLTGRLTDAGVKWVADRNRDGTADSGEKAAYLDSAIEYAGNIVDGYLCHQVPVGTARGQGNAWLRDRTVDIAAWRAAGHGGRNVPDSLIEAKELALDQLQKIKDGDRIPGFAYPAPINSVAVNHTPKVANVLKPT